MRRLSGALGLICATGLAIAQGYPARPIRMVVPTSPGGVTDTVARAVAPPLAAALGQSIVIDNRAGAGGIIGTDLVAKAAPDGYTVLAVFDSFVSNPHVFRNAPYDVVKDFAPISLVIRGPQLLVVHPGLGVKTFGEFMSRAKSRRPPFNFATAGAATSSRLSVELFKATAGLDANLVHYKGGGPALNDLLGGHIEAMIASAGLVLPHVKAGRLNALAVTSKGRSALVPGVPPVSEFLPRFEAQSWVGMLAPARTPRAVIQRLNASIIKLLATPEQKERFTGLGYEIAGGTPEQFGAWIRGETEKWGKLIREQRITAE
ncbi:MAG: tripartite tricarboxylate transporter substrate binding protein [Burkholderiales bacterium]